MRNASRFWRAFPKLVWPAASTTAAPETTLPETEPPKPDVPAIDGKGENFNILSRKEDGSFPNAEFMVFESKLGDTMNEAVDKRNRIIEEKYKVKIVASEVATADVRTAVQTQIQAQDTTYDLVLPTIRNAFILALEGSLYNVKDIANAKKDIREST